MFYALLGTDGDLATTFIGVFSTREKADEWKNKGLHEKYYLYETIIDTGYDIDNCLDKPQQCVYRKEIREQRRIEQKILQENAQKERILKKKQQEDAKKMCDDIIKKFDENIEAQEVLSGLIEQYKICCLHMSSIENDKSFASKVPVIAEYSWLELCKSEKYLSHIEMTIFSRFFKLLGIKFMCGFSRL